MSRGLCAIVLVLQACPLCCITCVQLSQLSRPTLYVSGLMCSSCGYPGPHSAPGGLCALQRFVYHASLGNRGLPSEPQDFSGLLCFPESALWSGPPCMSCLWAEKLSFLCFLPSKLPGAIMGDPTHEEVIKKIPDMQGRSGSHP